MQRLKNSGTKCYYWYVASIARKRTELAVCSLRIRENITKVLEQGTIWWLIMLDDIDVKGSEPQLTRKCLLELMLQTECATTHSIRFARFIRHDSADCFAVNLQYV